MGWERGMESPRLRSAPPGPGRPRGAAGCGHPRRGGSRDAPLPARPYMCAPTRELGSPPAGAEPQVGGSPGCAGMLSRDTPHHHAHTRAPGRCWSCWPRTRVPVSSHARMRHWENKPASRLWGLERAHGRRGDEGRKRARRGKQGAKRSRERGW